MEVGDLVVRIWNGFPLWTMVGIVIHRYEEINSITKKKQIFYSIDWCNNQGTEYRTGKKRLGTWQEYEVMVINEGRGPDQTDKK